MVGSYVPLVGLQLTNDMHDIKIRHGNVAFFPYTSLSPRICRPPPSSQIHTHSLVQYIFITTVVINHAPFPYQISTNQISRVCFEETSVHWVDFDYYGHQVRTYIFTYTLIGYPTSKYN